MIHSNKPVENYQKRLKALCKDKSSSLHDFTKFFQQGSTRLEGLTIQSLKRVIRINFDSLLRFNYEDEDQWKKYSHFDEVTQSQTFYPSKLTTHYKYQYKFLVAMSHTQLFVEFLQNKHDPVLDIKLKKQAALFIADWLYFKWKKRKE